MIHLGLLILRWGALVFAVLCVYTLVAEKNDKDTIQGLIGVALVGGAVFFIIGALPSYKNVKIVGSEYSYDGTKPFNIDIRNNSTLTYYLDDSRKLLDYTISGSTLTVTDDDVRIYWNSTVSGVRFELSDSNKKIEPIITYTDGHEYKDGKYQLIEDVD